MTRRERREAILENSFYATVAGVATLGDYGFACILAAHGIPFAVGKALSTAILIAALEWAMDDGR